MAKRGALRLRAWAWLGLGVPGLLAAPALWAGLIGSDDGAHQIGAAGRAGAYYLPIADVHLHPHPLVPAEKVRRWMDRNAVLWGSGGARTGGRELWLAYDRTLGDRFIPLAGQAELNAIYHESGDAAAAAETPGLEAFLSAAARDLDAGRVKGIGEVFIKKGLWREIAADSPAMRRLYELVAERRGILAIHMRADDESVPQLERLLASDRRGRVLWYHCGSLAGVERIRPLLRRHPNLYCGLASRYPPVNSRLLAFRDIFDLDGPDEAWRRLIEDFPERFLLGTDTSEAEDYDAAVRVIRHGLLAHLRPATARKVAFANAMRLFELTWPDDVPAALASRGPGAGASAGAR